MRNKIREKLPIYEAFVDDEEGSFNRISLVDKPAIEVKTSKDSQIIAGPIMIPNKDIYRRDKDGEYYIRFSKKTIKKLTNKFFRNSNNRAININHTNQMVQGYIKEHWIIEDSLCDKSRLYGFELPVGTSFVLVKIEDENFWNSEVKDNEKLGFSIEAELGRKLFRFSGEKV